jgi:hypothetical protein
MILCLLLFSDLKLFNYLIYCPTYSDLLVETLKGERIHIYLKWRNL